MRCPDCNKFVPQEIGDPEVELDVIDDRATDDDIMVTVTGTVRVPINCGECGTELKEGNFDVEAEVEVKGHRGDDCQLAVEETNTEGIERQDGKPGTPSRYRKTYYGASVDFRINCSCQTDEVGEGAWQDDMQASSFDELV
jgi:hypothetical protein